MARTAWVTLALLAALTAGAGLAADPPAKEAADPKAEAAIQEANARAGKMRLRDRLTVRQNFKQIGIAVHAYADVHDRLPADITDKAGKPLLSWRVAVLPHFYKWQGPIPKFNMDEPWDSAHNAKVAADNSMPKEFAVPGVSGKDSRETHAQSFTGAGAWLAGPNKPRKFADITDGLSNTVCVALAAEAVPWTKPGDIAFDGKNPDELLKGLLTVRNGFPLLLADGSLLTAKPGLPAETLAALVTVAGGETIDRAEIVAK